MTKASEDPAARSGDARRAFVAPCRLRRAHSHVLEARHGGRYRLDLALPEGVVPPGGWPALLLLDGDGCFATGVEAARRMGRRPDATGATPLLVVGVSALGAGSSSADPPDTRRRDFTSPREGESPATSGGAAAFLRFLDEEVLALVADRAPLDRGRCTLFGHSLAGYFALWVLANRPDMFRNYAAVSPSIWWDAAGLREKIPQLRGQERRARIFLGQWEDALSPWQLAHPGAAEVQARRLSRRLLANAREIAALLEDALGAGRVRFDLLADEDHASIVSAAIPRALRLAAGN